jgi:chaperonin GroES
VGPGRRDDGSSKRVPMDVKEGDRVLFAKYSGTEVKLEGDKKVLILKESDILAVIEK